ncbi:MAG TPA: iron-containing alcohol dehydrogenase [Candidatus Limnocylindrales bacterium]|nr:iron-containing alcohol dehydrogenase [Candidatus Limnocylindrales bacterium]
MRFDFTTSGRISFGDGAIKEVGKVAAGFGTRALVVTRSNGARTDDLLALLTDAGLAVEVFNLDGEPTVEDATAGVVLARDHAAQVVIGFGGGSAIDGAKAIAALTANDGDPLDYLEVIGKGKPLRRVPLAVIAIPTTAGTGSEVTANAVLASKEHAVKVSLRSPLMLPRVALIDPELTFSQPPAVTASTGMDALTQCIEPFVSNRANPVTDAVAREGIMRGGRSLRRAFAQPNDADARRDMSLAALFGGMALANAKLGAVHGFAAPIGGMFDAPHGAVCAILLPPVMEANLRALRERTPESDALARYAEVARLLTADANAEAEDGAAWARQLLTDLGVAPLSAYGVTEKDVPVIVEKASVASSMQGNPISLTTDELSEILKSAL